MARTGLGSLPGETHSTGGIIGRVRNPVCLMMKAGRRSQVSSLPSLDTETELSGNQSKVVMDRRDNHHYQPVDDPPSVAIKIKATKHGSVPRLTQLWKVALWTTMSPAFKSTSPSSSCIHISPERIIP